MEMIIRAKRKDNREWVYGAYFYIRHYDERHTHHLIIPNDADMSLGTPIEKIQVEIDPDTLEICAYNGSEEPSELLFVERKTVQEYKAYIDSIINGDFSSEFKKGYCYGQQEALDRLFGDKCLPDKIQDTGFGGMNLAPPACKLDVKPEQPSVQDEPRFKIGDKVREKVTDRILTISDIFWNIRNNYQYAQFAETGNMIKLSDLEPYAEPETKPLRVGDKVKVKGEDKVREVYRILPDGRIMFGDKGNAYSAEELELVEETKDMEEKELNLCELLEDFEDTDTTFYSSLFGESLIREVNSDSIDIAPVGNPTEMVTLWRDGNFGKYGQCVLYPSRTLYEKYPLDPYSAWMAWKESRKPKRWRAEEGKEYWYLSAFVIPEITSDDLLNGDDKLYECGNYFRTKIEARQAAEAVRECLEKFHSEHTKQ